MNSDKTKFMKLSINNIINNDYLLMIHNCNNQSICNMQNCKRINQKSKICYLGIIIDNNLRWNFHISNLVEKPLLKFIKLKDILPIKTLLIIYFAFYQSIYQYGLLIWGGVKENFLKSLQSNKNSVLRIILNKKS